MESLNNSAYITIGGHTVNHRSLGVCSKEEQRYEIGASLRFLEQRLGEKISVFSYPLDPQFILMKTPLLFAAIIKSSRQPPR